MFGRRCAAMVANLVFDKRIMSSSVVVAERTNGASYDSVSLMGALGAGERWVGLWDFGSRGDG